MICKVYFYDIAFSREATYYDRYVSVLLCSKTQTHGITYWEATLKLAICEVMVLFNEQVFYVV